MIPTINSNQKKPIYIQIYEYYKKEILEGKFRSDSKMPSIRELANKIGVSKTTVETAYQQLVAEGYLENLPNKGYYINEIEILKIEEDKSLSKIDYLEIEPIYKYDYRSGKIDEESFPYELWKRVYNKVLNDKENKCCEYGDFRGEYVLRKQISKYLYYERGVKCNPNQVVIGSGIQQLLNGIGLMLKKSKDTVIFEEPGFLKAQKVFENLNYKTLKILPNYSLFENEIQHETKNSILYLTPSHQFPLGSTMSIKDRLQIINWANRTNGLIIEDDYDSELRYEGKPIPSMQGLADGSRIIYIGSISKILSPAIRVSYMIIPNIMLEEYLSFASNYSQTASKLEQLCLAKFMSEGYFEQHIRKVRKIYSKKNQRLLESLLKYFGKKINVIGGETGHHLIAEINLNIEAILFVEKALNKGVAIKYIETTNDDKIRFLFSYAAIKIEDIEKSIQILYDITMEEN